MQRIRSELTARAGRPHQRRDLSVQLLETDVLVTVVYVAILRQLQGGGYGGGQELGPRPQLRQSLPADFLSGEAVVSLRRRLMHGQGREGEGGVGEAGAGLLQQ